MVKRNTVRQIVAWISPWDLTGSTSKVIETLKAYDWEVYHNNPEVISVGWDWQSPDDQYVDGRFILEITRLENDQEYNKRIKLREKEKKKKKLKNIKKDDLERQEYLRLKKKFEKAK